MTVLGVGFDVVALDGFAEQLADVASRFVAGTFRPAELADVPHGGPRRAERLGGRFAAKEAFVKGWAATRRGHAPILDVVDLREIEVVRDAFGRPALDLHGAVRDAYSASPGAAVVPHLSISHDGPFAAAVVVFDRP